MQQAIEIIIIEDEPMWSQLLTTTLQDFGFTITATAGTFESAVLALNNNSCDIVLLDINLHGKNSGIELGKMIHALYGKPFIFITASYDTHTAQQAIGAKPSAYLVKPVNPVSLFITVQSALNNFRNQVVPSSPKQSIDNNDSFFVKVGEKYRKIYWKDVVYLSSEKNYTAVFNAVDKAAYFIRSTLPKTLKYIIPQHLQHFFVQINRSEAVHLDHVHELVADEVHTNFKTFTVTQSYTKELKAKLNILA